MKGENDHGICRFEESQEVRQLAESLIDKHHPHLKDEETHWFYIREGNNKWAGKAKNARPLSAI
ncbi:putative metallopeptidase [Bacillus licheniformis]|nr:putative metallopeptidase [Bacillus licheniformis]